MTRAISQNLEQAPLREKLPAEIAHTVYTIIKQAEQLDSQEDAHTHYDRGKHVLAIILQLLKTWSCTYSYLTIEDLTKLVAREPFINCPDWDGLPYLSNTLAISFTVTGMYITYAGAEKSVLTLCHTENWYESAFNLCRKIKTGEISFLLATTSLLCIVGSGVKAYVGSQYVGNIFLENVGINNTISNNVLTGISVLTGFSSAFCYLAFQINAKAFQVMKIRKALSACPVWVVYQLQHRCQLMMTDAIGVFIGLCMSAVNGIALFYAKGNFDIELLPALYFVCIVISNVINNVLYISNPVYRYWLIKDHHKHEHCSDCDQNLKVNDTQSITTFSFWKTQVKKVIGAFSSIGTGLSFGPAIIHFLLTVSREKDQSQVGLPLAIVGLFFTVLMTGLVWPRDYTMWARGLFENQVSQRLDKQSGESNVHSVNVEVNSSEKHVEDENSENEYSENRNLLKC